MVVSKSGGLMLACSLWIQWPLERGWMARGPHLLWPASIFFSLELVANCSFRWYLMAKVNIQILEAVLSTTCKICMAGARRSSQHMDQNVGHHAAQHAAQLKTHRSSMQQNHEKFYSSEVYYPSKITHWDTQLFFKDDSASKSEWTRYKIVWVCSCAV